MKRKKPRRPEPAGQVTGRARITRRARDLRVATAVWSPPSLQPYDQHIERRANNQRADDRP